MISLSPQRQPIARASLTACYHSIQRATSRGREANARPGAVPGRAAG